MATKVKLIETGAVTGNIIPDGGIATGKLADDAVTTVKITDANITHAKLHTSMDLTGKTVTVATAAGSTNTTAAASTAFVQQELTTLIGGAPSTLNDLNELAAAINNDANYNSTLTTALATKLPLAGGTMTGQLNTGHVKLTGTGTDNDSHTLYFTNGAAAIARDNNDLELHAYNAMIFGVSNTSYPTSTEAMRINSSGKVGIGTDTPASRLHIEGPASSHTALQIETTTSGFDPTIHFVSPHNSAGMYLDGTVDNKIKFYNGYGKGVAGREITFDNSGNVGIGTTSPGSLYSTANKLVIGDGSADVGMTIYTPSTGSGRIFFADGLSSGAQYAAFISYNHADQKMLFGTGSTGTTDVTIDQYGNVGIGTSSPAYPLEVAGTTSTSIAYQRTGVLAKKWGFHTDNDNTYWQNITDNVLALTIKNNGNVGIGTTSPSSKLHIKHGDIRLEGNAESGQDITFTITNDNSGNEVEAGLIRFIDTGGGQSNRGAAIASYMPTADTGDLRFYTSAGADRAERMRIQSDGFVNIGGTSHSYSVATQGYMAGFQAPSGSSQAFISIARYDQNLGSQDLIVGHDGDGAYFWTRENANIFLGAGNVERVRIYGTGSTAGNMHIMDGNLSVAAGHGIDFSATANGSGTMANELLDDYEEGTWTPVFSNAGTPSYSTQYGRYTKVGRIVYCSIAIRATSVSSASTIGLDGLPFASPDHGDNGQRSCFIVANSGHLSSLSEATARFRINGSSMQGVKGNATTTYMTASEMTSSGTIEFAGAFLYYT